ncbi:MAG: hypothetical protein CR982_01935 [Candidatus Cloacimonadota bacterium]|nr:MAG: hypothetical protein CR982_01935 [Candidatus Cloacimonadota bacterium]PIE78955.1 MAG: hypothetical protein CSA15_05255 [Candidatus Delongbacteria bacterium]
MLNRPTLDNREKSSYISLLNYNGNHSVKGEDFYLYPENLDQLRSIIKISSKMNIKVVATGYTSKIKISDLPNVKRVFVSSKLMASSLDIDEINGFIEVESGANLRAVEEKFNSLGLNIPFYCDVDVSVGGFVSTINPLSKAAFYVKGIKCITASGEIVTYGTKTQKNVAGYDLTKLFVGTFGKLSYIYSVLFQLIPKEQIYFNFEHYHSINEIKNRENLNSTIYNNLKNEIDPENIFI